jgi:arsenate reductase
MECSAMDIIRTGEKIWKEEYAALDLNEDELVMVLSEAPILLERPIIVRGDLAFVARPTETMEQLL